jgi:ABC-2 type transport system permease protein
MSTDPPPPGLASQGVIHDLGYRHYDGPRLGRARIARALMLESARAAFGLGRSARSKVMPLLLLGAICLPAVIVVIVTTVVKLDKLPGNYTTYILQVQVLVMIFVASQSPASVSRDLRFRVVSLYFSRPIQRIDYVLAKYGAMCCALFVLMALPLTILFVGALLAKLPLGEQVPDYLRSLGGAVLYALVLAGIGLAIAALTPRRGLGVAAIIAVLAILAGVAGVVQGIAEDHQHTTASGYAGLLSPFSTVYGVQHSLLGADMVLPQGPPGSGGTAVFAAAVAVLVGGCLGVLVLRYRKVAI